jgi:ABC-type Fe3+/spermidine/putrescine transport system ATPase subunit
MSIVLEQISKHYDGHAALSDVTVDIADGEFFVLLGPSGSGKSTLLRAIAGLTPIDHGRIVLHGRDVTGLGAKERCVGFVFQNYALFRHMTVADNIEFALSARRVPAAERRRRRKELLELVALEGLDKRLPGELSGGQQQRVAVARALAHQPRVLLLDEPFGALDAKIREELRRAIRQIQRTVGITTILVTHDQEEAFTMADRIGVMDRGRLQEVGEPRELYARPKTRFVATFLGAANLLLARHLGDGVRIGDSVFPVQNPAGAAHNPGSEVTVVIRPEDIVLGGHEVNAQALRMGTARVTELEFTGSQERIRVCLQRNSTLVSALTPDANQFVIEASRSARDADAVPLRVGQITAIGAKRVHVLPTRISSLRLLATSDAGAERLKSSPLVRDLAQRMHIAPTLHRVSGAASMARSLSGLTVVVPEQDRDLRRVGALLHTGARQILVLNRDERPVERMLIYTQPSRPARDGALSAAGSLLRHMAVDATLLVPADEPFLYGRRYRDLLDIRQSALRQHGVDVRTESFGGDVIDELKRRLQDDVPTLLVIGVTSTSGRRALTRGLAEMGGCRACAAVLLTSSRSDAGLGAALPAFGRAALANAG